VRGSPRESPLNRLGATIAAALVVCLGCNGSGGSNACSPGSPGRCVDNTRLSCVRNPFDGFFNWMLEETCSSAQVCRVDTAGVGVPIAHSSGCFDPNAYCPYVGYKQCNVGLALNGQKFELYECALRASDQTLQWSATNCNQLVPPHVCYADTSSGANACVEVVEYCHPGPPRCDGNNILTCDMTVTDKAVWDWHRTPCGPAGGVCQVDQYGGARCVYP
jgi:hypothetical protein